MNRKALFLDLDGTLLNDEKKITEGNLNAIKKALDQGHNIIIATGRPLSSAIKQAKNLGLTSKGCYLISFNGGILYDTYNEKIIYKKTIKTDIMKALFKEAEKRNLHIQTYSDTTVQVEKRCNDKEVEFYSHITGVPIEIINIDELKEEPVKALLINNENPEYLDEYIDWILKTFPGILNAFHSSKTYIEVVSDGLDKGKALVRMADILNIPVKDTIAAGDEANDISMIKDAGIGVCMQNGIPQAKAIADYVTINDNNHDGIAEIICKFMI